MSWNENIKKILDFIPVFEANDARIEFLEKSNLELSKEIDRLRDEDKRKLEPAKTEVIKEVINYDDSELKLSLKFLAESINVVQDKISEMATLSQLNLLDKQFKSFAASSNDEINRKADSALRKSAKAIEIAKSVKIPDPYDDSELRKMIASIEIPEPYDDTFVIEKIDSIKIPPAYDDKKLKHELATLARDVNSKIESVSKRTKKVSEDLSRIKSYDDTEIKKEVATLEKANQNISNKLKRDMEDLKGEISSISEYDDTSLKRSVKELSKVVNEINQTVGSMTEYDDEKIKGDVDSLRLRAEKLDKSMSEIKKELTEFKKAFEVK